MTCSDTLSPGTTAAAPYLRKIDGLPRAFGGIVQTVKLWHKRRHERQQLRDLPEYLLRDVGLDVADARFEADKPFWRR